jgi:hypothetical protein
MWLGIFGAGLLYFAWSTGFPYRANIRRPKLALALVLGGLLAFAIGCKSSGGNGVVASGSGVLTLQGTSGNISHTAQLAVTVE